MSRSIKKTKIAKWRCRRNISWKKYKVMAHRTNRARVKDKLRHGMEVLERDFGISGFDFDFCKEYIHKDRIQDKIRILRK